MLITRYLAREIGGVFTGTLLILLAIFIGNRFAGYLAEAVAGDLPVGAIFILWVLKLPSYLTLILPVAVLLGSSYKLMQVSQISEGASS
jgi:lipopolysaccharide export system permease protein